jgi:NADH:ubiquinone oxidoreductase subunit E
MDERQHRAEPDLARVEEIIARHQGERWPLIPVLQEVQEEFNHVPPAAIPQLARAFRLFPAQVQGVITFYEQLYTEPRGRKVVRVCRGTACHVRGGKTILKLVQQALGLKEGETDPDFEYTLETVACIGVCALAPNVVVGTDTHSNMNPKRVSHLFGPRKVEE